jgi:signal transduction histidine kinase/CheY-like chemotaxis protein
VAHAEARPSQEDIVADRDKLIQIGCAAVLVANVVFGAVRFGAHLATGLATPWAVNAGGALAIALLYAFYRGDRPRRSSVVVHGTALIATIVLAIPAAYGMTSSKWWLALVGFSTLLMGRRREGIVWAIVSSVLLPLLALVEHDILVEGAIGEPPAERAMAGLFFIALLLGVTWAFRRAAQQRAHELVETAASLERSNLVKSRFLAHMSHEIRTPLHGVIAMTDMALQEEASRPVRDQIQTAQQSARTLLGLLTNVLDVARAESDALELERRPFDLHATLTDVLQPLAAQARAKGLEVTARADPGIARHRLGDRVRFGQIVMNLVSNALKFTTEGAITVRLTSLAEDRLRLTVSDTGRGIPSDKLDLVFEPFAQASVADQRIQGGVGLGLAIVRELVRRMDGSVGVTSARGEGSTFTVELVLPSEGKDEGPLDLLVPAEAQERTSMPAASRTLDVLVCEDNLVNQKVLRAMLARLGHRVTMAGDGLAAWAELEKGSFDLVLTDVEMPGLDGVELTRRIRAREVEAGSARVPIVGATAHVGEAEQHRLVDAGMDAHLGKPFTLGDLSSVIDRAGKLAARRQDR